MPNVAHHLSNIDRRVHALMLKQEQEREPMQTFGQMEMSELKAIMKLGRRLFGDNGLVEFGPNEIGIVYLGYYIDPPSVPSHRRARKLLFRGAKYREIAEQARLWKSLQ